MNKLFIKYILKRNRLFYFNSHLIVNILSSLFLGFLVALNITNKNLILLSSVGFLGCFSTFSSFIYQLFNLIYKGSEILIEEFPTGEDFIDTKEKIEKI